MREYIGSRLIDAIGSTADWVQYATCAALVRSGELSVDDFFPGPGMYPKSAKALAACTACPVRAQCLDFALAANEKNGIWGGLSEHERRRIRRRRTMERKGVA